MKKGIVFLAIVSLVFVGTLVTYKQAFARPYDCGMVEDWCLNECYGEFYLYSCQDCGSHIECEFDCLDLGWPYWPCPWSGDVTGGLCWL